VDSIVIVWGESENPLLRSDLPENINVRIRNETIDSLNNRFLPDPKITTEAVFSLDDDTLMLCQDVENGFEEWKLNRNRLAGFFPRLVVENFSDENLLPHRGRIAPRRSSTKYKYLDEREAFRRGEYNMMLTVAMFYNVALMEQYWQPVGFPAAGRELVDRMNNCEDILMNYIAAGRMLSRQNASFADANSTAEPVVKYVRPRRRLDLSKLTSVGISHHAAAHLAKRERCVAEFSQYTPQLPTSEKFVWGHWREVAGRPICWVPFLGCIYL
jgi:hypothetical protein